MEVGSPRPGSSARISVFGDPARTLGLGARSVALRSVTAAAFASNYSRAHSLAWPLRLETRRAPIAKTEMRLAFRNDGGGCQPIFKRIFPLHEPDSGPDWRRCGATAYGSRMSR